MGYDYGLNSSADGASRLQIVTRDFVEILLVGGTDSATKLLEDGYDINTVSYGNTALSFAALEGNKEVVDFLLKNGAKVNQLLNGKSVSKALHKAVEGYFQDIVEALLENGAVIMQEDLENGSLLNMALSSNNQDLFQDVFDYYGPEVDYNEAISKVVKERRNTSIVKRFLTSDCTEMQRHYRRYILHSTAKDGYVTIAKLFVESETSDTVQDWVTSIQATICQKENKIVKGLLFKPQLLQPIDLMSEMDEEQLEMVLFSALEMGNGDVVTLLRKKTDFHESLYKDILLPAIEAEDEKYLKWVIDFKFQVKMGGHYGNSLYWNCSSESPLQKAVEKGNCNIIELLLSHSADIDALKASEDAFLHAIKKNQEAAAKLLLEKGVNIDVEDKDTGKTALLLASEEGQEDLVKLFLEKGANIGDKDQHGRTCLHLAAKSGNESVAKFLLQAGLEVCSVDNENFTALHIACQEGSENLVKLFLKEGANICAASSDGLTVLHSAAIGGDTNIVKLLLGLGCQVDQMINGKSALYFASLHGKAKIVELLLGNGATDDAGALLGATEGRHTGLVKSLITDYKFNLDCKDSLNCTALHTAAKHGYVEIVKYLLDRGADIDAQSRENMPLRLPNELKYLVRLLKGYGSALHYAYNNNREKIVQLLLERGVDIDKAFKSYLIKTAIVNRHEQLIKCLVDYATDLEVESVFCAETLLQTLGGCLYTVIERLLDFGVFIGTEVGEKALQTAIANDNCETLQLLLDYQVGVIKPSTVAEVIEQDTRRYRTTKILSEMVTRHIVKMIYQNLHVPEDNLTVISNDGELRNFKTECELEIEQMKSEVLENYTVSFYEILTTTNLNRLLAFAQNTSILKAVSCWKCKVKFPIYHCVLRNQLRRGVWRKQLLSKVHGFFRAVAKAEGNENLPILPVLCTSEIFSYLENKDLKVLMRVCNIDLDNYDICNVTID